MADSKPVQARQKKTKQATTQKKAVPGSFADGSPWIRLHTEVNQTTASRQPLLARLEDELNVRAVSFFRSFKNVNSQICDADAEMLESLLAAELGGGKLLLIINAPGGQALAAERIVNICRAYSNDKFEVLVPHMAKSAATMICFGANTIHMSKTSELGPVDPQVVYTDDTNQARWISADEYVRSYEDLLSAATSGNFARLEPFLQQLNRFDARYIEQLRSARKLAEDISIRLLQGGMMKGQSVEEVRKAIDVFLLQQKTSSHGRMINYRGAEKCGLSINLINLNSDLWTTIWELFIRSDWLVSNKCAAVMETARSSVSA